MSSRAPLPALLFVLFFLCFAHADQEQADAPSEDMTDWMNITSFAVEASLGAGLDENGELTGQAAAFSADVGVVYCRVTLIGADEPQAVEVIWFREDQEVSRRQLRLTQEEPVAVVQRNIPAAQAGSWRVEVVASDGEILAVLPFVVGESSSQPAAPPTKKKRPPAP